VATMASMHQQWNSLRICAAHLFRRTPWLIVFLQRIYQQFRPRFSAGAVGLLFNSDGEILLVEHIFHPHYPWGPPGGWVDRDEAPATTVAREMQEEVGLQVQVGDLIHVEFLPQLRHMTFAYLCTAESLEIKRLSPELIGYGWYKTDALPMVYPYIREAVHRALARIANARQVTAVPLP